MSRYRFLGSREPPPAAPSGRDAAVLAAGRVASALYELQLVASAGARLGVVRVRYRPPGEIEDRV